MIIGDLYWQIGSHLSRLPFKCLTKWFGRRCTDLSLQPAIRWSISITSCLALIKTSIFFWERNLLKTSQPVLLNLLKFTYTSLSNYLSWDHLKLLVCFSSGATTRQFVGHTKDVLSVAFSADNRQIVSGSRDKTIKLWNTLGVCKYTIQVSCLILHLNLHYTYFRWEVETLLCSQWC